MDYALSFEISIKTKTSMMIAMVVGMQANAAFLAAKETESSI